MKAFYLFKQVGILLIALFCATTSIQATNVTVNVPAAGQLSTVLSATDVDSLTVTGFLNSSDFSYMRSELSQLTYLNLLDATVENNTIPSYALEEKTTLKKVILPSSITSVNSFAFYNCSSLSVVDMPDGLQTLANSSFSRCALVGELILPDSLASIGNYAFDYNPITNVIFPEGLETIGYQAFYYCSLLSGELLLPSTLNSIDSYAFAECYALTSCKITAITPPAISSYSLGNITTVYVPQGAGSDYRNAPYWDQKMIIEGEGETVTVTLTQAGTLGAKILEQIGSLYDVNRLVVSGPFNDTDWGQLKNNLPNLISVDLSAITATAIPNSQFENKSGLLEIKLPDNLLTIGSYAFYRCHGLQTIDIPSTVTTIGEGAFYECRPLQEIILPASLTSLEHSVFYNCDRLESVVIPNGVTLIKSSVFAYCYNLKQVTLPNNLIQIESSAFYNCTVLSSIQLPNSLTTIGNSAFSECTSLSSVELPVSLASMGSNAFRNCPFDSITLPATLTNIGSYALNSATIKKITCLQPTPPVLNNDPFNNINKSVCELIVPFWAETSYRLANIWSQFQNVSTWNAEINYLPVSGTLTLSENIRPLGNPTVEIMPQGDLSVLGIAPFNTNEFILKPQLRYISYPSSYSSSYSQLINEYNTLNAENVKIDMSAYGNRWYYLSFPFDVAMSDISIDDDAYYVFRYYDGVSRAEVGTGSSWKNVEQTDTLRAGTGYIFQCSKDINHLVLPATSESKNRLFTSTSQAIELNEYVAENAANRNWNLTGNPFPSHYDIHYMDYTAPITYWNDYYGRYEAVSPVDDAFVLQPMQAFFVQKPNDLDAITFTPEGRQTSSATQLRSSKLRSISSFRTLINLTLSDEKFSDKSRIVLNQDAQLAYEIECDAAKFMSTSPEVPQLYSIDRSSVHYAINERPVGDGIVPLGIYTGNAGTFNITLQEPVGDFDVLLKDKKLDKVVDLSVEEYTFYAEAGTFEDRFELQINEKEDITTGYLEPENVKANVYAAQGAIVIENATGTATVYSVNGIKVAIVDAQKTPNTIVVPQGVYIVKVNGETHKTVVF